MSRPKNIPAYRLHKQSGQAVVTLNDGLGGRRDVLHSKYGTAESRAEYARLIGEWDANCRRFQIDDSEARSRSLSINELLIAFIRHAEQHYWRADGTTTNELNECKAAFKPLKELSGALAVTDFSPLKLKAVREKMIEARCYLVRFTITKDGREKTLERHVWEHDFRRSSEGVPQARRRGHWYPAELLGDSQALSLGVINSRIARIVRLFKWAVSEELLPE